MKILFVHEVDYKNKVVYEIHEFPELLSQAGHEITFFNFPEGSKCLVNRFKSSIINGRVYPNVQLRLVNAATFGLNDLTKRIFSFIKSYFELNSLLKNSNFDAVVLYAVPTYGLQVCSLAKKYNVPVVFRALDVSHKIRAFKPEKLIQYIERYVYRNSTLVSANNPEMLRYCEKLAGQKINGMVNFPPLDLSHFSSNLSKAQARKKLELPEHKKIVVYVGTFFYFSGIPEFIQETTKKFNNDWPFLLMLVGGGEQEIEIRNLAVDLAVTDNLIFTGFVPYSSVPVYLSAADVALNPMKKDLVSNVAFPQKVLQYVASGLPTVSTKLTGIFSVLGEIDNLYWANNDIELLNGTLDSLEKGKTSSGFEILSRLFDVKKTLQSFEDAIRKSIKLQRKANV